ncbi:hypothetical protein C8F01DRAFT_1249240 [Mycena amicta]|nr:hypothetical protein C8F01DRAFT_1249240 [Mycena amicta]
MASTIQTFPVEVLATIFRFRPPSDNILRLSHVCVQWRAACLAYTAFWNSFRVRPRDVLPVHYDVVRNMLGRSSPGPLHLVIDFASPAEWVILRTHEQDARRLIVSCLRRHIATRVWHLGIYASRYMVEVLAALLRLEKFQALESLAMEVVPPWVPKDSDALPGPGQLIPVYFQIPQNHHTLRDILLKGVTLKEVPLRNAYFLRVKGNVPSITTRDGNDLSEWVTRGAYMLSLEGISVPPLIEYTAQPFDRPTGGGSLRHLNLAKLRATRVVDADGFLSEFPCDNFFDALYSCSAELLTLHIDRWSLSSRVWNDFLYTPTESPVRFPNVLSLKITGMHFRGMSYAALRAFLANFPQLRSLTLLDCPPNTWRLAMEVFRIDEGLCASVDRIWSSQSVFVWRDDPLPFAGDVC